jgi:hypothetical protein
VDEQLQGLKQQLSDLEQQQAARSDQEAAERNQQLQGIQQQITTLQQRQQEKDEVAVDRFESSRGRADMAGYALEGLKSIQARLVMGDADVDFELQQVEGALAAAVQDAASRGSDQEAQRLFLSAEAVGQARTVLAHGDLTGTQFVLVTAFDRLVALQQPPPP